MVLLGTVGLLYIMFLAGLEVDLHELERGQGAEPGVRGGSRSLLPQVVGAGVGRGVLGMGWPAAILLGSVFASHTLLAYPAAARLGLQKARATTTAVGATILTDTLALLVLAVIASGAREGGGFDRGGSCAWRGSLLAVGGGRAVGAAPPGRVVFPDGGAGRDASSSCSCSRPCSRARWASRRSASSPSSGRSWPGWR